MTVGPPPILSHAELEGERALLRPLSRADVEPAFAMLHGRREVLDWLVWSGPDRPEDLVPYYSTWRAGGPDGHDYRFAIVDRADEQFVGSLSLQFVGHPYQGEIGYWIDPGRWRRGIGTDAVRLATWLGFEHLDAVLVVAIGDVENLGSRRVLEHSGYAEDWRSHQEIGGRRRPAWHMSVTRPRFRETVGDWSPARADVERDAAIKSRWLGRGSSE